MGACLREIAKEFSAGFAFSYVQFKNLAHPIRTGMIALKTKELLRTQQDNSRRDHLRTINLGPQLIGVRLVGFLNWTQRTAHPLSLRQPHFTHKAQD